jgi:hypothetical protein
MMRAMTSSNIAVNCAAALSDCVCFAEVASRHEADLSHGKVTILV